jgi:hypothetical protein
MNQDGQGMKTLRFSLASSLLLGAMVFITKVIKALIIDPGYHRLLTGVQIGCLYVLTILLYAYLLRLIMQFVNKGE